MKYHNKFARIGISMQNRLYNADRIQKYIYSLLEVGFSGIEIQIADTLHRHDLIWQKGITAFGAYDASIALGDTWENRLAYEVLILTRMPISIRRWNDYLSHPFYEENKEIIEGIYKSDFRFRSAIENDVSGYLLRKKISATTEIEALCKDYLLEEMAVMALTNKFYPAAECYAGNELECQRYLAENAEAWKPQSPNIYEYINLLKDVAYE